MFYRASTAFALRPLPRKRCLVLHAFALRATSVSEFMSRRCSQGHCSSALPGLRGARAKRVRLYVETLPKGQCSTGPPKLARCARRFACACAKAALLWRHLNASKPKPDQCLAAPSAAYIVHCCGLILARCSSWRSAGARRQTLLSCCGSCLCKKSAWRFRLSRCARQAFQTLCPDAARKANVLARSQACAVHAPSGSGFMSKGHRKSNVLPGLRSLRAARDKVAFAKQALFRASRFRAARDKRLRLYVEALSAGPMFQRALKLARCTR